MFGNNKLYEDLNLKLDYVEEVLKIRNDNIKALEKKIEQMECEHPISEREIIFHKEGCFYRDCREICRKCDKVIKIFGLNDWDEVNKREIKIKEEQLKELKKG